MPARTASINDDIYKDIHMEMDTTKSSFSYVVNRRLKKLMEIELGEPGVKPWWAKVYRKDMSHPFCVEVKAKEYNRNQGTWNTHPGTMIQKVAESQALRRAFQISGIYSPEEMPEPEKPPMRDITQEPEKKKGGRPPVHDLRKEQSEIIDAESAQKK